MYLSGQRRTATPTTQREAPCHSSSFSTAPSWAYSIPNFGDRPKRCATHHFTREGNRRTIAPGGDTENNLDSRLAASSREGIVVDNPKLAREYHFLTSPVLHKRTGQKFYTHYVTHRFNHFGKIKRNLLARS